MTTAPAYRWPEGILPAQSLPDVADPRTAADRGLVLWVPLDYLHDHPLGAGCWALTTAPDHHEALREEDWPDGGIGGRELHVVEVAATAGRLLNLRLPHLTAVSHEVVRTQGQSRWSARFPAYIVH
ncbi:hypothetical protein AUQ48_17260 [Kocuria flava]|uniref:Uncharacterized protein n=1 Tax=Kocuria flava TaxID=446860 RepID=A0A2N4SXG0_9MICC|nr:hypothetical protein [Kocuria flava]PLC10649.1 hypothetical protein AUQ48_17260 [Kocuria flava]